MKFSINSILGFVGIIYLIIMVFAVYGYVANASKLFHCSFSGPSYGTEILRGICIIVPPVGAIEGYMDIQEGK